MEINYNEIESNSVENKEDYEMNLMNFEEFLFRGIFNPDNYRLYYRNTELLIGSLDEEAQEYLKNNKNFNTYKGAVYENVVGDMIVKQGYKLYFYKNEKDTIEMNFFVRDANTLISVKLKATDGPNESLNNLINKSKYKVWVQKHRF